MPKVSIILPCYNVEKYIAKSIQSVLDQSYTDFELLVIIDGSPDNSKAIAESFIDSRITVYEKPNGGLSDARNYGLERAIGEFVYFMDSDDWIEPNLLEDNIKIVEEENLNFIVFGYIQDNEDPQGNIISSIEFNPNVGAYVKSDNLNIDVHHLGLLGYAWNKIYRRSFIEKHQFRFQKGISLVEDILFNAPLYSISKQIKFNDKSYYHYISRSEITLMKSFHKNSFELKVQKNIALEEFFSSWKVTNKNELLADSLFLGLKYCILNLVQSDTTKPLKLEYLRNMISHPRLNRVLKNYLPEALKDKILLVLIRTKSVKIINFLRQIA
ncbi:glycosyltransferase family 2 protein [Kaistella carnis]|uniref:glycosyltransferase family 2 protein n=1 Tax=Kaistella carnis TaxID=1241979 RepID=UPI00289BA44C|nr:glycosyltransferase family 2 protein [Kaistella carnis]